MIGFIQYNSMELINIIKNGIPTLIDKSGDLFPFESMTKKEIRICQNNAKARNIIMCALSEEEISKMHVMVNAKEIWDTLALTYEDSKEVEEKEEKKKKFSKGKKSLMSTWEDLNSSSSNLMRRQTYVSWQALSTIPHQKSLMKR